MKRISILAFMCIFLLSVFSGCISSTQPPEKVNFTDVTVQQGKEMIDRGGVFILDVRTQEEYDAGHIRSSIRIPVQDIPQQELNKSLGEIPQNKKILVYCRTGHRSALASEILVNNGFKEIYNLKGGITEWTNAGFEVIK
jgi:rhodanese-related sulfurtransferase